MLLVPKSIALDEPCVRCVMHPYGFKKNKIQKEALMPPPQKTDVSLLRLRYTTKEFCVLHGRSMQNGTFRCLATLTMQDVTDENELSKNESKEVPPIVSDIVYGPMHQGKYVLDRDVYVNDPVVDLPMHADLRYNIPYPHPNGGEVATRMRKYARALAAKMQTIYEEATEESV